MTVDIGKNIMKSNMKEGFLKMFGAMPPSRYAFGPITWYSLLIVTGIAVAIWLASKEEKRLQLPKDTVIDLAFWVIPFGIVGARLYYVALAWDQFSGDLIRILYIWKGGIAIYGAVIGGLIACFLFARKRKLSFLTLVDMIIPGLVLAQAIGRWGNYFNMEAYGETITNPLLQFFPFAVQIMENTMPVWHMATFFYESLWNFVVFIILMCIRKKLYRPGDAMLWYLMLYGAGRAFIEGLRMDSLMSPGGGIRVSQWLSIAMCLFGVMVYLSRCIQQKKYKATSIAAMLFSVSILAQLFVSFTNYTPPWVSTSLSVIMAVLLVMIACKLGKSGIQRLLPIFIVLAAYFVVFFDTGIDPLFEKTMKIMLLALLFPTLAYLFYPYTKYNTNDVLKEDSPCET